MLKDYDFGFTDIVKRSTTQSDDLTAADWIEVVPGFISRINAVEPRIVCIMALNDYRDYVCPIANRISDSRKTMRDRVKDGWQPESSPIGKSRVYVTYNPAGRPVGGVSRKDILVRSFNQIAAEIFTSGFTE